MSTENESAASTGKCPSDITNSVAEKGEGKQGITHSRCRNTPWSLHFSLDGTEDIGVILDRDGEELVRSREFWLPEAGDPIPETLTSLRLMTAAPALLAELHASTELLRSLLETASQRRNHATACRIVERIEANLAVLSEPGESRS